ncbi:MAG: hypothetical protein FJY83_09045 [Candidatus Aminicenantes bacterium]|nr:hypothetical protein [Candidatus Aminicenantes bacterium]
MVLFGAACVLISPLTVARASGTQDEEWRLLLKKSAEYCRRLERAALDFICLERISESVDFSKDVSLHAARSKRSGGDTLSGRGRKISRQSIANSYVYDYQLIRKGGEAEERRILIEENGEKRNVKDAPLKTLNFVYRNALFGPLGVLGEAAQSLFEYGLAGEETIDGRRVFIVETRPKPGAAAEFLYGKAWIRADDAAILKIQWNPEGIGRQELFRDRAERYGAAAELTMVSDFTVEKNGIRFPSRFRIEEAYIDPGGKRFVRSETTVVYDDFSFFVVEVDVIF